MARINEEIVLNYYLKMMDEDKVEFLKGKIRAKQEIQRYIRLLQEEEQIHNRIGIAKDLWKILFEEAMSYIHADKLGYDDLFSFFDKYVEFEELIFATDSFYRDHTLHCLWVYFLGEYIYYKEEFYNLVKKDDDDASGFLNIFKELIEDQEVADKIGEEGVKTFKALVSMGKLRQSVRCITALSHDLGYPIKKINRINASIGKILPNFSIKSYNEFEFTYNNEQVQFIKSFIDFIGDEIHTSIGVTNNNGDATNEGVSGDIREQHTALYKKELLEADDPKTKIIHSLHHVPAQRLRYANDFEKYQHGIMSAYLLMNTLRAFKTMDYSHKKNNEISIELDSLASLGAKQDILKAISDHTSDGFTMKSVSGTSEYLTFIDELEEFSRISRGNQYRQYINEFCKTDLYQEGNVFHVDFIFDNDEVNGIDPERAFKGKCKRMLSLFVITKLQESVNFHFRFIGKLRNNQSTYELIMRKNFAQIIIDGEEQSIPEYLKSRDFLTREEYAIAGEK